MKVMNVDIGKIIPYEKNPRKNDGAVKYVVNSIKEFGFQQPIVIDKNYVIIAGHTRYKAAIELNMGEVPCVYADELTPQQVKAYRLADNKTGEFAGWDFELLESEKDDLKDDFNMADFGFFDDSANVNFDDFFEEREESAESNEKEPKRIQCPHCGEWIDI